MNKSRSEIQKAILNNDPKIKLIENSHERSKSEVWRIFSKIEYENSAVDFVCCLKCKHVLSYKPKFGTGTLLRHKCTLPVPRGQPNADAHTEKTIPKRTLDNLAVKQLAFVAKDLLPFTVTEGHGFREYAQALINIGAKYGVQRIDDLILSRKTLTSSFMMDIYNKIKSQLQRDLAHQHLALTTDVWTHADPYTQTTFLTLSAHYINEDFDLKVAILGTKEFLSEKKTGVNVLSLVSDILEEFELKNKLESSVIVTDNGANGVAAFSHYKRLSCACHNLNLVMDDIFEKHPVVEIKLLIDSSKKLIQYFKHSGLNNKLTQTLKQHIKARWDSIYEMLLSIHNVHDEIKNILLQENEFDRLDGLDFILLEQLLAFLKPFKECSEKLSPEKEPTMHIFTLWSEKLMKKCATEIFDSDVITELKGKTLNSLKKRFQSTTVHLVGLFLNPPFKELNFLSEESKKLVLNSTTTMLKEISDEKQNRGICEKDKPNFTEHEFAEFLDANHSKKIKLEKDLVEVEMHKYCSMAVSHDVDVLKFWKNATDLKLLQELARQILAIPVSSATSERVFSISGTILNEKRTRLLSSKLDKILFLYKNM